MQFFIDYKKETIYVGFFRNSYTLLSTIEEHVEWFKKVSVYEFAEFVSKKPDAKIYMPFRNPEVRYCSGLAKHLAINSPILDATKQTPENYNLIKNILFYLKNLFRLKNEKSNTFPFHLYDRHCDHIFWCPIMLGSYGLNVKLIPMHEWSDHLKTVVPSEWDSILQSIPAGHIRSDSFHNLNLWYKFIWDTFQTVIVKDCVFAYTFNDWIKKEIELFNTFEIYYKNDQKSVEQWTNLMDELMNDPLYFTDFESPYKEFIKEIICDLNKFMPTPPQCVKLMQFYAPKNPIFNPIKV